MMKLLREYKYLIIILVFLIIFYLSYNSYKRTRNIIETKYETQKRLVENSIINALQSANGAYSISENVLNDEMKYYSKILLEKYKKNPDISTWDLKEIQKQIKNYEIYIIDRNLKIIKTTFKKDLGMDFSKFTSFAELLKSRLEGNSFVADKMDISTNTGKIKKYSYMPTPDHKYLLELSINITERYSVLKELNVFSLADKLVNDYRSVENISFYKFNKDGSAVGKIKTKKNPINTDIAGEDKKLIREVILSNSVKARTVENGNFTITNKFIPFLTRNEEGENNWWNSFVVGITYNNKTMLSEIYKETRSFLINILIIAVVFILFMLGMIYLLRKTEYMAYHDHLTGLANRKAFEKYFNQIKNKSKLAVLYIDLDNFKVINDKYGHDIGDRLLKKIGRRIKNTIRNRDKVSRVGGDEFTILLTDITSRHDVNKVIKKLKSNLEKPFIIDDNEMAINCSIGYSVSSEKVSSMEELIKKADISMYQVKKAGR